MALPGISADLPSNNLTPPVGSLIASGATPPDEYANDEHWTGGIRFSPPACKGGRIDDSCASAGVTLSDAAAIPFTTPFALEAGYRASATGNSDIGPCAEEKARAALFRNQSRMLELEFWDGIRARGSGINNQFLSNAGVDQNGGAAAGMPAPTQAVDVVSLLTGGPSYKIRKGFGALEHYTMDRLGGSRCMLHVPTFVVPYLTANNIIERQGQLLLTKLGNIVVAGAGYSGSAPGTTTLPVTDATQDSAWLYGTDIVTVWLEKQIHDTNERVSDGMNLANNQNTVEYRASRFAATTVNRCVTLAVKIDLANS